MLCTPHSMEKYQWLIQALVENEHKPHNWQLLTLITVFVCVKIALILKNLLFSAAVAWCLTLSHHHSIPSQSATKINKRLSFMLSVIDWLIDWLIDLLL